MSSKFNEYETEREEKEDKIKRSRISFCSWEGKNARWYYW